MPDAPCRVESCRLPCRAGSAVQGTGISAGSLPCLEAPRAVGGQRWGALPKVALPIATTTPLRVSKHITGVGEARVMTSVQAGERGLVPLTNTSQTISWPRAIREVNILASLGVLHSSSLLERLSLLQTPRSVCSSSLFRSNCAPAVLQLLFIAVARCD